MFLFLGGRFCFEGFFFFSFFCQGFFFFNFFSMLVFFFKDFFEFFSRKKHNFKGRISKTKLS